MDRTRYTGKTPLDVEATVDHSKLKGKSVIVTGGASGLGEHFVRAFVKAGSFVTIGDLDSTKGTALASELGENAQFSRCDINSWEDQLALFKLAIARSPRESCDIVVANAGISGAEPMFATEDTEEPEKPNLQTLRTNLGSTAFTAKLAMHYLKRQADPLDSDRCLIMTASLAGYLDQPKALQYNMSKWGVRSMMRTWRQTSLQDGIRINIISPWYIRTGIGPTAFFDHLETRGIELALPEDAAAAVLHIASVPTIHGRSVGIVPRKYNAKGYLDLQHDDEVEGSMMWELEQAAIDANL